MYEAEWVLIKTCLINFESNRDKRCTEFENYTDKIDSAEHSIMPLYITPWLTQKLRLKCVVDPSQRKLRVDTPIIDLLTLKSSNWVFPKFKLSWQICLFCLMFLQICQNPSKITNPLNVLNFYFILKYLNTKSLQYFELIFRYLVEKVSLLAMIRQIWQIHFGKTKLLYKLALHHRCLTEHSCT